MATSTSTSTASSSEFGSSPPKLRSRDEKEEEEEEEAYPDPLRMHPVPDDFKPPAVKDFSFSVSGMWKSNGNMLRWITEVPSVHHDMTFEPAACDNEKRLLDSDGGHDGGEHFDKKAKLYPTTGHRGAATVRRRGRIVQSTCDAARRLSSSFQSVFSSSQSHAQFDASTVKSVGSPTGTPLTVKPRERLRFAVVGDYNCGKTCMLLRFYFNTFTRNWNQTQYELFNKTINVDGKDSNLELWDTSGRIELHQLSLLSYLAWDGIFLCFSVNSDKKFVNARTKWINEIHMHCRGAPIFLIGLKKDTRVGSGIWAPLFPNFETRIGASEGAMAANGIGAAKYMECSAKTGDGVYRVFEEGVRMVRAIRSGKELMGREKTQNYRQDAAGITGDPHILRHAGQLLR
ncbi:hypothetical protein SUNI508_11261 [Seiridium unicorne]|uniref:Uncharacterized protein n=1 Tax=Seiridium unicorne TaxID=138068 RepID=A0ABR2UJ65_9PEZI